jgi:hypothetical protein
MSLSPVGSLSLIDTLNFGWPPACVVEGASANCDRSRRCGADARERGDQERHYEDTRGPLGEEDALSGVVLTRPARLSFSATARMGTPEL